MTDPEGVRPGEIKLEVGDITACSRKGLLYNLAMVPTIKETMRPPLPNSAVWGAITASNPIFFLGGGDLVHGLFQTFESLFRMKLYKGESLQVVIPLIMTYSSRVIDPEQYILAGNAYQDALLDLFRHKLISAFSITIDGASHREEKQVTPYNNKYELHWFSVFDRLLTSSFFPETNTGDSLKRVRSHFCF